jgi:hypothetical protein
MTTKTKSPAAKKAPARKKPTGPRAAVGKTSARVEVMRAQAFAMLVRGQNCTQIGEALGVSRVRGWQLAKEGLDELRAETMEQAAEVRLMQTQRHMTRLTALDAIVDAIDDKNQFVYDASARANAVAKATQIEAEIAKLWGSYMPTKVASTTPDGSAPAAAFAVPVALAISDWAEQAQLVLEQGEAAAVQLTEGPADGAGADD